MKYGLKLTQNVPIDTFRTVWRTADDSGFDHCWNMDHFATLGDDGTGRIFDAWTMLAAMAEVTSHVRIGCMVTGNTYRHPGVLAKQAVTVDHLSGGRLEFGLGSAWAEREHTMLGLEFGTAGQRLDRLDEACRVIRSLWTEAETSHAGTHYQLASAIAEPKPVQQPYPPIWIGGSGRKRTLRITAEYADAWNAAGGSPEEIAELSVVLDQHCADIGRDPSEIRRTIQLRISDDDDDKLLSTVESYAAVGVTEIILIVRPASAEADAERLGTLLSRLRSIG